jgi:HD-like signal output (HDOD) protein
MPLPLPTIASRVMTTPGFSFPRTIEKLESLFADPAAPSDVAQAIIGSDPILTAVTLSQANLSGEGVTRLSDALRTVGLGGVIGISRGFQPVPSVCTKYLAACWNQANACAIMTPLVAKMAATHAPGLEVAQMDDQTLSIAGLLHDLGTALALVRFTDEFGRAAERQELGQGPFSALLKHELGVDSCDLGYLFARNLNLPSALTSCIRFHPRPGKADAHPELVAAVHIARLLVRGLGHVAGPDRFIEGLDGDALSLLHLRLDDYPPLLERFLDTWEAQEMYEVGAR